MKARLLALALGAALSMGLHAGAQAADMRAPMYKAPAAAAPMVFNWTGIYAGVNLGGAWTSGDSDFSGVVGGGQIGGNYQINNIVLGVEADIQGSSQKGTETSGIVTLSAKTPWFATVRGRIGLAWDRWMVYGTGGWAGTEVKLDTTITGFGTASESSTKSGWTAGGGVEWAFWDRWSAKAEYLYIDTGNHTFAPFNIPVSSHLKNNVFRLGVNYHF
ncbi:MAG TPA: outer membrane protein [Xanthobacteraceae bacterium]|jgi:outer membrane immunogenic protein|nr:outer membrane protein [Xanthobacteraceae bacterium]